MKICSDLKGLCNHLPLPLAKTDAVWYGVGGLMDICEIVVDDYGLYVPSVEVSSMSVVIHFADQSCGSLSHTAFILWLILYYFIGNFLLWSLFPCCCRISVWCRSWLDLPALTQEISLHIGKPRSLTNWHGWLMTEKMTVEHLEQSVHFIVQYL